MRTVFATLLGGPPWGFRIQGGRGTGLPLRLSRVNPDSRAACQGLQEGDVLRMINGHLTEGLTQAEARDVIREAGRTLALEIQRGPSSEDERESVFTTSTSMVINSPLHSGLIADKDIPKNGQSPEVQFQKCNGIQNGHSETQPLPTTVSYSSLSSPHPYVMNCNKEHILPENTVITDQPPPPGAVLISEKVTVDGDQVHRDKYYAIPVKEVIKEKSSETKFIPAPPKYEGIGPTEEGIPLSLRQSVKKENMSDWYKTMYKTLHKIENEGDTYVIGYTSDPEVKDKQTPKKLDILGDHPKPENPASGNIIIRSYSPTSKSPTSFATLPRSIADYEPGYSSVVDNQPNLGSKRYFPTVNQTKPAYEIKDGFEPENYVLKRNLNFEPDEEQQKIWYRQVQKGGEIPQFGLGKAAPEKRQEPVVGPPPPPPADYYPRMQSPKVIRPPTLPPDCSNVTDNGLSQQCNGFYADQMRQAIHNELQLKGYQVSPTAKVLKRASPEKRLPARVLYNFTAESPREISLKKDDIVLIHRELDKNWYEGEFNTRIGIFPISYVEVLPPEHTVPQRSETQEGLAKVLYDFNAHTAIELNARKGDEIHLTRRVDDNWYEGKLDSKKGIIPASYISVVREPGMVVEKYQILPQLSSPRSTEISRSSPVSPLSSASLSSPSITSGIICPPHSETKLHTKKGSHLVEPVLYRALYRYTPQNDDELEMIEGDSVYVVEMCDDGWYVGRSVRTGELGIIPGNYVEKVA